MDILDIFRKKGTTTVPKEHNGPIPTVTGDGQQATPENDEIVRNALARRLYHQAFIFAMDIYKARETLRDGFSDYASFTLHVKMLCEAFLDEYNKTPWQSQQESQEQD